MQVIFSLPTVPAPFKIYEIKHYSNYKTKNTTKMSIIINYTYSAFAPRTIFRRCSRARRTLGSRKLTEPSMTVGEYAAILASDDRLYSLRQWRRADIRLQRYTSHHHADKHTFTIIITDTKQPSASSFLSSNHCVLFTPFSSINQSIQKVLTPKRGQHCTNKYSCSRSAGI